MKTSSMDPAFAQVVDVNQDGNNNETLKDRYAFSLLLPPRSLLIIKDDMYTSFLHGIKEVKEDKLDENVKDLEVCKANVGDVLVRRTRVSLTIRLAQKTSKFKLSVFKT